MTSNQINWLRYREEKRNNLATLEETGRHNRNTEATELGKVQVSKAQLNETARHNQNTEANDRYRNVTQNDHWIRSDLSQQEHWVRQDAEQHRANVTSENLTAAQIQKDRDIAEQRAATDLQIGRERNEASVQAAKTSAQASIKASANAASANKYGADKSAAATRYAADQSSSASRYSADTSAKAHTESARINAAAQKLSKEYDVLMNDKKLTSEEKQTRWRNAVTYANKKIDQEIAYLQERNKALDRQSREYIENKKLIEDYKKFKEELPIKWTNSLGSLFKGFSSSLGSLVAAFGG